MSFQFLKTILFTLSFLFTTWVAAQNQQPTQVSNEPLTDSTAIELLNKYILELRQPYYVFHWFSSYNRDPIWKTQLSINTSSGYDHLLSVSDHFWQALCTQNESINPPECHPLNNRRWGLGGLAGPGLYAALDAAATQTYGGDLKSAVLMQTRLPKGFRVVDVSFNGSFPPNLIAYFDNIGCRGMYTTNHLLYIPNSYASNQYSAECVLKVRSIFKSLKIGAIIYGYSSTYIKDCDSVLPQSTETDEINTRGPFGNRAFNIIDPRGITPSDVKIYTANMSDGHDERVQLTSFFRLVRTSPILKWDDVQEAEINTEKASAWVNENIMGCQKTPPYRPQVTNWFTRLFQ